MGWKDVANIDLARPFGTKAAWRLVVTQGPEGPGLYGPEDDPEPGPVRLCLTRSKGDCGPGADVTPHAAYNVEQLAIHEFQLAKVVYPRGRSGPPLLLVRTASLPGGDGDHGIFTQVFAYRRAADRFEPIYDRMVGSNNNQEIRYIEAGPLAGSVVSAEPTEHLPYRFWIVVSRLTPGYTYRQVLRYRSATGYMDGNPLAVIDSEMPNIQRRLGVWRAGQPLPLPANGCAKPRLVKMELWCGPPEAGV